MKRLSPAMICCVILWLTQLTTVNAQWISPAALSRQMYLHERASTSAVLFIHFDKTIYTNNETAWFTGYLLKGSEKEISKTQVMSVALIRDIDSVLIRQEKYLMSNSLSFGCMTLPDNLALNDGTSSLGTLNSGKSLTHTHNFSGSIRLPYKVEFTTDAVLSYRPASAGFDKAFNTYQWNTSLGISC